MGTTKTKIKFVSLVASAALVAMLGLASCGSGTSTSTESSAAATSATAASASSGDAISLSTIAKELFQNCLAGEDDKNIFYFYAQGEDDKTATLVIYDTANDACAVHSGAYDEPTVGTVRIDTMGAGEAIEFKVVPNADKTAVDFTFDNGSTVTMGPVMNEKTEKTLQELDQLIAMVNEAAAENK